MLKKIASFAAHRVGAFRLVQRLNESRVRILMYHRFSREHAANFDRQCAFLAENYDVVPLADALARLEQGKQLHNLAVVTIDDGYKDVYDVAFPVLSKYRLPATLFVTTGFIERRCWMPGDHVRFFLAQTGEQILSVVDDHGVQHLFRAGDCNESEHFRTLLKRVSNRVREQVLRELIQQEKQRGVDGIPSQFAPCSWDQLREMARNGIAMGAHTVTHPILSRLETAEETQKEILTSKLALERELGQPVETFAYPNGGVEDINALSVDFVRRHFRGAVTAIFGLNAEATDRHQLLRLPCDPDLPVPNMERMLAGPLRRSTSSASQLHPA